MPRTTREYLLRYREQAHDDLDNAMAKLEQMRIIYEPSHPEYAAFCDAIKLVIFQAQNELLDFKVKHM